jgi:hypothetical protein
VTPPQAFRNLSSDYNAYAFLVAEGAISKRSRAFHLLEGLNAIRGGCGSQFLGLECRLQAALRTGGISIQPHPNLLNLRQHLRRRSWPPRLATRDAKLHSDARVMKGVSDGVSASFMPGSFGRAPSPQRHTPAPAILPADCTSSVCLRVTAE